MSAVGSFPLGAATTLAELAADPHPRLARLRAHEPVSWLPELDGWLVTRRDLALNVMRDPATFTVDDPRFSTAQVVGPSMLSLDGDEHARHREPFTAPFRPREVRVGFAAFIERETDRLITALEPAGAVELRRAFAGPLAVAVVTEALGLVGTTADTVLSWYDSIVRSVSDITAGHEAAPAGAEAYARLRAAVEATVADPGTASLLGSAAERLALPEVASNAAVLMFGGIETTEAMITNALLHLLRHPDQLALVRDDDGLLDGAIEESLRLEPGAAVVDRYATRDTVLGPATIRRGELVTVSLSGANRDPAVFADPDRFDVRRENARLQLAFAHGPHYCLAAHLARLETRIALQRLLERLPALRLDPARPATPQGLVFRKPPTLHVLWDSPA
ncbi:cytochrome P450 [Streptomyces sp. RLB3-17]|uniref:cytochrome P450 n=1 Tax=unclassified Streptomyces TaxID=2593676 RepID=UPI001161F8EF|nr:MULTISPECIES: cytochrome P450 [unclassified Streptomyces]QDN54953.1 cytochrome P450 [Streptomyces sp. S1D4-20]QDN65133.1 cytochrome P450 [Streptomyces sp. S1D4-14]QDO37545.1 cytochrome P450 [Streptomyces sp. RLB3-17]QDO47540.1 cytochrome P450 [Streptomyces sp. RLB3-5]QDO57779.1 cytochrome P450 [Streptomyces sp. RLB1-8]